MFEVCTAIFVGDKHKTFMPRVMKKKKIECERSLCTVSYVG